ncbi:MAG: type II toxin-antitoxin system Phd/YefM family antitoxin [Caldilineaceae bacterium]
MIATMMEIDDAQTRFRELLAWVAAGHEVLLTDQQKPVVRLMPAINNPTPRVAGLHAGMAWMSEDFDAPLPDEFWLGGA